VQEWLATLFLLGFWEVRVTLAATAMGLALGLEVGGRVQAQIKYFGVAQPDSNSIKMEGVVQF
jgi:hypothetical protein